MNYRVITIGRQKGSGGHEIGQRTADALGVRCYDQELLSLAVKAGGMDPAQLEGCDERTVNSLLYSIPSKPNPLTGYGLPLNDTLFLLESQIICDLAAREPCVIVGRCADYVLREREDLLSVFVGAPLPDRIERVMRIEGIDARQARALIRRTDRQRRHYYQYYTKKRWGAVNSYHLCFDSSKLGIDATVEQLVASIRRLG